MSICGRLGWEHYQRVINPWQTPRELQLAVRFIERMLKGKSETERRELLRLDEPMRHWPRHGPC